MFWSSIGRKGRARIKAVLCSPAAQNRDRKGVDALASDAHARTKKRRGSQIRSRAAPGGWSI
jgi:hypothetical protein